MLASLLTTVIPPASAQGVATPGTKATGAVTTSDADDDDADLDEIRFALGMAISVSPKYSGSDQIGFAVAPAARLVWRGYSISTSSVSRASSAVSSSKTETGLSGPLYRAERFAFGFGATLNRGRNVSDEDARLGLKDVPLTLLGRMRIRYAITPDLSFSGLVIGDLLGRQKGLEVPMGVTWRRLLQPGLLLSTDVGTTWASARTLDLAYGIGPNEQAASGLPLYSPKPGFREVSGSIGLVGEPSSHWVWVARLSVVRLIGPAARSPIVKRVWQPGLLLGFAYRFTLH